MDTNGHKTHRQKELEIPRAREKDHGKDPDTIRWKCKFEGCPQSGTGKKEQLIHEAKHFCENCDKCSLGTNHHLFCENKDKFLCRYCKRVSKTAQERDAHKKKLHTCKHCTKCFGQVNLHTCKLVSDTNNPDNDVRGTKRKHQDVRMELDGSRTKKIYTCRFRNCGYETTDLEDFDNHRQLQHFCTMCSCECINKNTHKCKKKTKIATVDISSTAFTVLAKTNKGALVSLRKSFKGEETPMLLTEAVNRVFPDLVKVIRMYLESHKAIKLQLSFTVDITEIDTKRKRKTVVFNKYKRVLSGSSIEDEIYFSLDYCISFLNLMTEFSSGIVVDGVESIDVNIGLYRPIRPRGWIPMPAGLKGRHGLVNIRTKDDNCFRLSVLAALYGNEFEHSCYPGAKLDELSPAARKDVKRKMERPSNYKNIWKRVQAERTLDFSGFNRDFDICDIPLFETKNNLGINVFEYCEDVEAVVPFRITEQNNGYDRHIDLLLLREQVNGETNHHFVLIRDPARFFGNSNSRKGKICPWCTQRFRTDKHMEECQLVHSTGLKPPTLENKKFQFRDFHKCLPPPYRMYTEHLFTSQGDFKMAGYGYVVVGPNGEIVDMDFMIGEFAMDSYMEKIFPLANKLSNKIRRDCLPIPKMSGQERQTFEATENCAKCKKPFSKKNPRTRHHSHHIDGHPIEPVCNWCNLKIQIRSQVPMFCHTHAKVSSHMLLASITSNEAKDIKIIPRSNENFVSIIFDKKLKLVDSRRFLNHDLQDLIKELKVTNKLEPFYPYMQEKYLRWPVYFPHTWFTDGSKLDETSLPPFDEFEDILIEKDITREQYNSMVDLYNQLGCQTFHDFCMHYLKNRVFTLAAAMEEFGDSCFKTYELSPLYEMSLASYAYSLATFHCKENFEIPTDPRMIKTILDNVRGGVSLLTKRIVTAKSERLGHENVADGDRVELLIADLNSLYQFCLMEPQPFANYRMLEKEELQNIGTKQIMEHDGSNGLGRIYVVDLHYPDSIKLESRDFPYAPVKQKLDTSYFSQYQHEVLEACGPSKKSQLGVATLLLTQEDKKEYACHYKLLRFFIRRGMVVTKVHDVIEFEEKPYLRDFIAKNIQVRRAATDKFHEKISKNIGNMTFGKFLSVFNTLIVKAITDPEKALDILARHNFEDAKIISEDLGLYYLQRPTCKLDKNILVAFTVLELAKLKLYELVYDVLKVQFKNRITVIASETDSLFCEIRDPNKTFLSDMYAIREWFDFSTLPKEHPLKDDSRAKEPGLLKVEYPYALEYIGLKTKMYSIQILCSTCGAPQEKVTCTDCSDGTTNVAKGGPRKSHTCHDKYRKVLLDNEQQFANFTTLQTKNQLVSLLSQKKLLFTATDFHRKWLDVNSSEPFGFLQTSATNK